MAAFQWSNAELGRVYAAAYLGRNARLCLANATTGLTLNSTTAAWDAAEITSQAANGYARYTFTLAAGSYDSASQRFQTPVVTATFQAIASGGGLNYNSVYLVLGNETNIAGLWTEAPNIVLAPGQPRAYNIRFVCDDITTL
jgi:hypothetical protein